MHSHKQWKDKIKGLFNMTGQESESIQSKKGFLYRGITPHEASY